MQNKAELNKQWGGCVLLCRISTFQCPLARPDRAPDLAAAPVGPELGGAGPQHVLVVCGGDGGADQWPHPEDPLHETGSAISVRDQLIKLQHH